jgi:preprotein translocase subunit SecG
MTFIIIIHVIICVALIGLVLIQRGRGSGLVESFSGVESMFGTKTNTFLTRTTTILSILFFFTCLSLAVLSVRQSRSLMSNIKTSEPVKPVTQETNKPQEQTSQKTQSTQELP